MFVEIFNYMKNLFVSIIFNFSLFVLLMVGIQNSSNKSQVNLIIGETIKLPLSFIIGISFIGGSFSGSLISISFKKD